MATFCRLYCSLRNLSFFITPRITVLPLPTHPLTPWRRFCSEPAEQKKVNTKVNFCLSGYSDSDSDSEQPETRKEIDKSKLPPPYDPFNKKPSIEEPEDQKDLQYIFHKMSSDGLTTNAVKMFDALSKDGLTHEALELFSQIKDKGQMPDVVAYTAVIEAYANAGGQSKEAVKTFLKMMSAGVSPNVYTYKVLVKGLVGDGKLREAKKYVLEMMGRGMKPNVGTYTAVFEAFAREEKVDEARELLVEMKEKGFVLDEKGVREAISNKRGPVFRVVMDVLFGK